MNDINDTAGRQDTSDFPEAQDKIPNTESEWPHFHESSRFESAVMAVSSHVQVAYEMALSVALGAMATACQGLIDVEFPNGHRVPTSLMLLVAAKSGERKTALENWFFDPIRKLQSEKETDLKSLNRDYAHKLKVWKDKEKVLRKKIIKAFEEEQTTKTLEQWLEDHSKIEPNQPTDYRLIYENTTPSALIYGLHTNIPVGCLLSNEAGSLFRGKAFEDLYLFNSLWSGSSIHVSRRTSESFTLNNARLTAALMIQPEILQSFLNKRGNDAHGSGFLARFLFTYPTPMVGNRNEIPSNISDADINPFQQRVREILSLSLNRIDKKQSREIIAFTSSAKSLWNEMYKRIELEMRPDHLYSHAESHASKLMDNISRIAGILHVFEGYDGDIDSSTLKYAYRLGRHYSRHYLDHIAGEPEVVFLANRLVQDIRKITQNQNGQYHFVISEITQRGHPSLRKKDKMRAAITLLKRLGHLEEKPYGKQLVFSETLIGIREPELRNGEIYHLDELPRFDDQFLTAGRGIILPRYHEKTFFDNQ